MAMRAMPDACAAVAFDATAMKLTVIEDSKLLEGVEEGSTLEYEGTTLTVLQLCKTITDAKVACDERTSDLISAKVVNGDAGIDRIVFDRNGEAVSEGSPEDSESSSPIAESGTDGGVDDNQSRMESEEPPLEGNSVGVFREMLANWIRETDLDISRLQQRKETFKQLYVQYFGTGYDGSITETFDSSRPRLLTRKLGSKFMHRRITVKHEPALFSHIDELAENRKRQNTHERYSSKRARYEDDEDWYAPGVSRRAVGQIGQAGEYMRYPYISESEEEEILLSANGSASAYAQKLAKALFPDTLELYFKDQDIRKRQWIHEAVDFRFPSEDRNAQMLKWKNCSNAINKNMRIPERERQEVDKIRHKEVDCKYVSHEYEAECFLKANKDPAKYTELMALKLFEKSLDKFFKEQDNKRKDWLRECVDRRFYCSDKQKRDQRWKVCAASCNKNRTKIIGHDGMEEAYPYFDQELEEECFRKSGGVPYIYAESMCKLLFPDTQHLLFKDQDIGKRNWLHDILDRRFPTPDKVHQIAKWKSCTSAINKNKSDISSTSPTYPSSKSDHFKNMDKKEGVKERENKDKENRVKKEETESGSPQSSSVSSSRRQIPARRMLEKEEIIPNRKESSRLGKGRKEKVLVESYTSYPFVSEEEELECLEKSNTNCQVYARAIGRILFKDSVKLYYKDQDPKRRQWMREIVDFRFPSRTSSEHKQKWKNVTAAINKNMTLR